MTLYFTISEMLKEAQNRKANNLTNNVQSVKRQVVTTNLVTAEKQNLSSNCEHVLPLLNTPLFRQSETKALEPHYLQTFSYQHFGAI